MKTLLTINSFMFLVAGIQAQFVSGTSSGVFVNPDGPAGAVVVGAGTSSITWGTPVTPGGTGSGLILAGSTFQADLDQRAAVANLTYTNGTTVGGSSIESVDLSLNFDLTMPSGQIASHAVTFGIDSTTNTSSEEASADSIRLLTPYSGTALVDGDSIFSLRLFFGDVGQNAVGEPEQVILLENNTATFAINGIVCRTREIAPISSTFSFTRIVGGASVVSSGEGTNSLETGTPGGAGGAASVHTVTGHSTFQSRTEIPFKIGTLSYLNGTVAAGSSADGATLSVDLGADLGKHSFPLAFILTNNNSDPRASADIIELSRPVSENLIELDGITYAVRLSLTNPTTGGFTNVSSFAVEEGETAEADIMAVVTRFLPEDLPLSLWISRPAPSEILLSWPSRIGVSYQLESSDDLSGFLPDGDPITATNTSVLVTRPISGSKFYRVSRSNQ